jgi:alpha/beta superfamily hydrolase
MSRSELVSPGIAAAALAFVFTVACVFTRSSENLEATVCGWFRERAAFATWSRSAGAPDDSIWRGIPAAAPVTYNTRDGRTLRGYKIAAGGDAARKGFVLVAQGNAMLAEHLLGDLSGFAERGLDVFVYDYRGYGNSEGRPRLKAIVSDYSEIFAALSRNETAGKYLYGISFGGIVLLNVIGSGALFDRAVIDSSPSRISPYGCPEQYDPVVNLPQDASRLMIISGMRDDVITPADMREMVVAGKRRGAATIVSSEFAHAFLDPEPVHRRRLQMIRDFLLR